MAARQCVESRERDNRSNGKMSKTVQTQYGEVTVETPRDRNGSLNLKQCEIGWLRLGRFLYAMTDSYKIKHIHRCSRNDGCNELIYIKRIEINNSRFRFN